MQQVLMFLLNIYLKSEDCAVYKKNQRGVKRVLSWFEKTPDSQIKGQSQLQKY